MKMADKRSLQKYLKASVKANIGIIYAPTDLCCKAYVY